MIDCETDPFEHGAEILPFLWVIYNGSQFWEFEHTSDAVHFLMDKEWIVYAHNGGKFDYMQPGFLKELNPGDKLTIINGRLAKFKLGKCEFRDSVNILPIALKQYGKTEIDYAKMKRNVRKKHMAEIVSYCRDDCRYLYELVTKFRDEYGSNLTLAGAAMKTWVERFNNEAPETDGRFFARIKPFYCGGRVECFKLGLINSKFSMVDINSAYPYAMTHEHPIATSYGIDNGKGADIVPQFFYEIEAESDGALPYRDEAGKLTFPSDKTCRKYSATGWEIIAGLETKTLRKVKVSARVTFPKMLHFRRYVSHFYEAKKNAPDPASKLFAKLMLNSLYGKFGSDPENYGNFEVASLEDSEAMQDPRMAEEFGENYKCVGMLGPWSVMRSPLYPAQMRYYNVATAASITGFVRAYLWRHCCAVKKAGGDLIYCDTDSLAFTGKIPSLFRMDKEIGGWSLEGDFVRGGVAGKKLYAFDRGEGSEGKRWKYGAKGVRIKPEDVLKLCKGEAILYKREAPTYNMKQGMRYIERTVKMTGIA